MELQYWSSVVRSAVWQASQVCGFKTWGALMMRLLIAVIVVGTLLLWGSDGAANDDLLVRGVLAGVVISVFPILFLISLYREPPKRSAELEARLASILKQEEASEYLDALADDVSRFIDNFVANRPGGERDLSYVGKHQRNNPDFSVTQDSTLTSDDDDFAKLIMGQQDDRRRYDQQKITMFIRNYSGRIETAFNLIRKVEDGLSRRQARLLLEIRSILNKSDYYFFQRSPFDRLLAEIVAAAEKMRNNYY